MMTKHRYQQLTATIKKPTWDGRLRKSLSIISCTIYIWKLIPETMLARDAHGLGLYLGTQLHSYRIPPNKGPVCLCLLFWKACLWFGGRLAKLGVLKKIIQVLQWLKLLGRGKLQKLTCCMVQISTVSLFPLYHHLCFIPLRIWACLHSDRTRKKKIFSTGKSCTKKQMVY